MKRDGRQDKKMIHVRLSESEHRRLRIRVAEEDTSIQDWVAELIKRALKTRPKRK